VGALWIDTRDNSTGGNIPLFDYQVRREMVRRHPQNTKGCINQNKEICPIKTLVFEWFYETKQLEANSFSTELKNSELIRLNVMFPLTIMVVCSECPYFQTNIR